MNLKTIADAIATQFAGTTATAGSTTYSLAVTPTATLPNTIAKGPVVLVFHPVGQLEIGVAQRRNDHYDFPVRLLTDPLDYPRRSDALYAWATALRDKVEAKLQLGLTYVAQATAVAMRIELDGYDYGEITYDMVEIVIRVHVIEIVATVAV